jgi:hypothetical protein
MRNCTLLAEVDLRGLRAVRSIGQEFLSGCSSLRRVALMPSRSIASVGSNFLLGCDRIEAILAWPDSPAALMGALANTPHQRAVLEEAADDGGVGCVAT